jgi:hypothetical protein
MMIEELLTMRLEWTKVPNEPRWYAFVGGEQAALVLNDYPEEPLYTVEWRDMRMDIDETPHRWAIADE